MCTHIRLVTLLFLVLSGMPASDPLQDEGIQDLDCLGLHAVDSGFHGLDSSICQWTLDFGFQSFVVFQIPCAVF